MQTFASFGKKMPYSGDAPLTFLANSDICGLGKEIFFPNENAETVLLRGMLQGFAFILPFPFSRVFKKSIKLVFSSGGAPTKKRERRKQGFIMGSS